MNSSNNPMAGPGEGKIFISNLPNTTEQKDILEYLATAGPIREYKFEESGQRCKPCC